MLPKRQSRQNTRQNTRQNMSELKTDSSEYKTTTRKSFAGAESKPRPLNSDSNMRESKGRRCESRSRTIFHNALFWRFCKVTILV